MKRLTLLRHAQAEQAHTGVQDFDRHLTLHGLEQARHAATLLSALSPPPTLIVASASRRTQETAAALQTGGLRDSILLHDERLYLASGATLLSVVREADPAMAHLLLVGHNPGVSELCRILSANPDLPELATAAFTSMVLSIHSWNDVHAGIAQRGSAE